MERKAVSLGEPKGSGANGWPADGGSTSASVTLPVSNSTHVSVELGFFSSPSVSL
jgi:hypothetical protein